MLDRIHNVTVVVDDIDRAVNWYQTSFRCELAARSSTQAVMQFANLLLKLTLPSQQPGHVAFEREDAATIGRLKEQIDGSYQTFISDSAGNPVGIVAAAGYVPEPPDE